ncbi:MAG: FAD-binding oxidoreductase, partial [Rhodobacteraceae bacterium]
LVIGSMGRVIGGAQGGLSRRWAARQLAKMFPDLGPVRFEEAWDGDIAMTPDHLPRVHRLADGVYTAIGYNGRGITTGTVFGQAMADLLTGMDAADLPLPVSTPQPARGAAAMSRFYALAFTATQVWRSL